MKDYKDLMAAINDGSLTCDNLHDFVKQLPRIGRKGDKWVASQTNLPANGVYFALQNVKGCEHIIYIGSHRSENGLLRRINNHFHGTVRNSVFRKHIGIRESYLKQSNYEEKITQWINENISFALLNVPFNDNIKLEKELIRIVKGFYDKSGACSGCGVECGLLNAKE